MPHRRAFSFKVKSIPQPRGVLDFAVIQRAIQDFVTRKRVLNTRYTSTSELR
jgi:hypothetical protein